MAIHHVVCRSTKAVAACWRPMLRYSLHARVLHFESLITGTKTAPSKQWIASRDPMNWLVLWSLVSAEMFCTFHWSRSFARRAANGGCRHVPIGRVTTRKHSSEHAARTPRREMPGAGWASTRIGTQNGRLAEPTYLSIHASNLGPDDGDRFSEAEVNNMRGVWRVKARLRLPSPHAGDSCPCQSA